MAIDREPLFWSKVERGGPDQCWEWTAFREQGYGRFAVGGGISVGAHRFAYELLVGPIPAGLTIDHLCRNRACVNPTHLEPVTRGENTRRGINQFKLRDRCSAGHPYSDATTYRWHGKRLCRICRREAVRRYAAVAA